MQRAMKDSGIEWIGEIPADWEVKKLKYIFFQSNAGEVIDKSYWHQGKELLYTCQKEPMYSNYSEFPETKRTTEHDLLLTRNATPYIFVPEDCGIYSNVVQRITLKQEYNRRYIRYALLAAVDSLVALGDTIPSYNMEIWNNIVLPISEQLCRIADYLDRKCGQIDAIIARQQEVIEKLKAYKRSVITEAVTKGLNPNAPMKNSGIEWIGKIPEHWGLQKLTRCFKNIGSGTTPKALSDNYYFGDIPWLQSGDINGGDVHQTAKCVNESALDDFSTLKRYKAPFIAIAMYGASIANVSIVHVDACTNQACCALSNAENGLYLKYAFYSLQTAKEGLLLSARGGTQPNISQEIVKQLRIPFPTEKEQYDITGYLDRTCERIDATVTRKQALIETLKAYKKSLIYEVVTGKKEV